MKKFLILLLTLCLLLTACGVSESVMIPEDQAIAIAFEEAVKYADGLITQEMGECVLLDDYAPAKGEACYEITFDAHAEETVGYTVKVIVILEPYSGEVLEIMQAV